MELTDAELRDAAWKELTLTTDSYPTWKRKGFPAGTHWAKAKALLDQIGPPTGILVPPTTIKSDGSIDVTAALLAWLATVPDGSTIAFPRSAVYRIEGTLLLRNRYGLVMDGGTFTSRNTMTSGVYADGQRAMWLLVDCDVVFKNMTLKGAYTHGGTLDETLQHAHAIDLRGTHADIQNVTISDFAGDGVYFGLDYYDNTTRSSGTVKDSTIRRTGRNGVSVTAGNDVLVQRVTTDEIGFIAFDVEPNPTTDGAGYGTSRVTFDANLIGSYYLYAYAIIHNTPNNDQAFTANKGTSSKGLRIWVGDPGNKGFHAHRVTIFGNSSPATQSPAIEVLNVDTLIVSGNVIPTTILLQCNSVTGLTFTSNTPNTKSGCP